jgi:hypothetical protein
MKEEIEENARAIEESQQKGTIHSLHPVEVSGSDVRDMTEKRQDATSTVS